MNMSNEEFKAKLLNTTLNDVLEAIKKMAENEIWSKTFVAKCLLGFEQCLKVMDADYESIDNLTLSLHDKLPDVSFVTDDKVIKRFGKAGREALDEVD